MPDTISNALSLVEGDSNTQARQFTDCVRAVDRLPEDVLVEVFMIARICPSGPRETRCTVFLRRVSQVCSRWRRICISSPLLWNCIHIEKLPFSRFTSLCISRTKDVPISLDITSLSQLYLEAWKDLMRYLVDRGVNADRWKTLTVHANAYEVFPHLLEHLNSNPAPNLESLVFSAKVGNVYAEPHPGRQYPLLQPISPNLLPPNLRRLELARIHISHIFNRQPPVTLTPLTRLHLQNTRLDHYSPNTFAILLSSSLRLEELSIIEFVDLDDDRINSWSIIPPVSLSLRRLRLRVVDPYTTLGTGLRWVTHFLCSINIPKLQQLVIISPTEYTVSDYIVERLVDFISTGCVPNQAAMSELGSPHKLYPELRYFGILFPLPKRAQLHKSESLLAALPSLTHLRILGEDIAVVDRTPRCSPGLTFLSIRTPLAINPYPSIGDVLRRRQEAGFPIRVVALQEEEYANGLPSTVEFRLYNPNQAPEFLDL